MHRLFTSLCAVLLLGACAHPPGQIKRQDAPGQVKKQSAPGQVMHRTGCNPASGKCKDR